MDARRAFALVSMLGALAACADPGADSTDDPVDGTEAAATYVTVNAAASKSCSTAIVSGLSQQLVDELACIDPHAVQAIDPTDNLTLAPEVFPYLQAPAAEALKAALLKYGKPITVNSALRTLPQQYLLRHWSLANRCGISAAAKVGASNHESGLAIDVELGTAAANKAVRAALAANGFTWLGAGDPVHFDFKGGDANLQGKSVLAFKRLWNRNHPEARLPVDETYDAKTEAKLKIVPADGFATGARCDDPATP